MDRLVSHDKNWTTDNLESNILRLMFIHQTNKAIQSQNCLLVGLKINLTYNKGAIKQIGLFKMSI